MYYRKRNCVFSDSHYSHLRKIAMFWAMFVICMAVANAVAIFFILIGVLPDMPYLTSFLDTRAWYSVLIDICMPLSSTFVTESSAASVYLLCALVATALDSLEAKLLKKDTLKTADVFVTARQFDSIADCGK